MKIVNKIIRKLKSKKGGFKEIIYDNIGIAIVVVLIAIIIISIATKIRSRGVVLYNDQTEIETKLDDENGLRKIYTDEELKNLY